MIEEEEYYKKKQQKADITHNLFLRWVTLLVCAGFWVFVYRLVFG